MKITKKIIGFLILLIALLMLLLHCTDPNDDEENLPGIITQVDVPDSLEIPKPSFFTRGLVRAWVSDPNGLKDVDSVYFFSKKPDGVYANGGKPLVLVDNGRPFNISNPWVEAGDSVAGDGIYSLSIILQNDGLPGRYHFTFYLRDKAGHLSDAVTDSVEVVRQ